MMGKQVLTFVLTAAILTPLVTSCRENQKENESAADAPAPLTPGERARYVELGREAVGDLAETLGARLKEAIENGGPVSAVKVCQTVAQPLTHSVGTSREGVTIGRTALRYRNPANAPDATDRELLESWHERKEQGEILPDHELVTMNEATVRFYKPIILQPICLNCHGPEEQLLPELKATLDELYPEDRARNFEVGDLRGVFRVEMDARGIE